MDVSMLKLAEYRHRRKLKKLDRLGRFSNDNGAELQSPDGGLQKVCRH